VHFYLFIYFGKAQYCCNYAAENNNIILYCIIIYCRLGAQRFGADWTPLLLGIYQLGYLTVYRLGYQALNAYYNISSLYSLGSNMELWTIIIIILRRTTKRISAMNIMVFNIYVCRQYNYIISYAVRMRYNQG